MSMFTANTFTSVSYTHLVKEASGNFSQIAKILSLCGDRLDVYSGNDDQVTSALALGAKGVISVLANILPKETHDICQSYFDGYPEQSDTLQPVSYTHLDVYKRQGEMVGKIT